MTAQVQVAFAAALCAGGAAWVVGGRDDALRRARVIFGGDAPQARWPALLDSLRSAVDRFGWQLGREVLCLPAGLLLALLAGSVLPALAGAAAVPLAGRWLRAREREAAVERRAVAVTVLCSALAGDLRAGLAPHAALAGALRRESWPDRPELADAALPLLAAARFGGDVPAALRSAAGQAGAEGLAGLAACWQVAVDGGAGLADGLDRIAAVLRAEHDQRDDLRAQLAGPRSTAAMLALLPALGVLLGTGFGADPLRVLLHTPAGLACLLAGGLLEWAGLAWTSRIVRSAEGTS
ncbi:type II secretion system F family protein [Streptomyces sp. NBC_01537]|uniref:type II secretion system F family protein n=1 Tax=Streptomyces sp. NBC_01537 TaxID=2903896 RepID=UPI00386B50A4